MGKGPVESLEEYLSHILEMDKDYALTFFVLMIPNKWL